MAPSEVPASGAATPHLSSSSTSKKQKGTDGASSGAQGDYVLDSSSKSGEEAYWAQQPHTDDNKENGGHQNDDHHERGDSGDDEQEPPPPEKPRSRNSLSRNSGNNNGPSPVKTIPEVIYAKAGILLSPPSVIMDKSGGAGELTQILPGETIYINKANGQYQLHPSYATNGNGHNNNGPPINGNGNYNNNGNGKPGHGTILHPYNTNGGVGPPHYPFLQYPQPQPGAMYPVNYYGGPHGQFVITSNTTSTGGVDVRGEEVGIVLVVLLLWVGAIILFFNRWGKIRMLEPYQPKFCENHRPSCPMAEVTAITNHPCRERTFSKYNLSTEMLAGPNGSPHFVKCNYQGVPSADPAPGFSGLTTATVVPGAGGLYIPNTGFPSGGSTGMLNSQRNSVMIMNHHHHYSRPRQNSVFVTSPSSQVSLYGSDTALKNSARKTKSAVDLPTLVLTGEFMDNARRNSKNSITQL